MEEESAENCLCLKEFKLKEIKLYSFVVERPSVQLKMWVKFIVHSFFFFFPMTAAGVQKMTYSRLVSPSFTQQFWAFSMF